MKPTPGIIRSAVSRAIARMAVVAFLGWEAGIRWKPERGQFGWPWGGVQTPDQANDPLSRVEIIRRAHHAERNNWFAVALGEVWTTYTVGSGLPIRAASSDQKWNDIADEAFRDWCELPDLSSTQNFDSFQCMSSWRTFFDGSGYIYKTSGKTPPYRPRIQFIEAAMVQTPPDLFGRADIFDGVERDSIGRRVAYYVRQVVNGQESYVRIPAKDITPICDITRPGETHSFSVLAPVLEDIQDLKELADFAMAKAKDSADITNVYETHSGELPTSEEVTKASRELTTETASGKNQTVARQQSVFKRLGRGRTIAIEVGEKVSQLRSESPNEIEQSHWRVVCERVCAGTRIPIILVLPASIQGTVSRAVLDHANTHFKAKSKMFQAAFVEIWRYVIEQISFYDARLADKPADWRKCIVRHPRGCNVDIGRNSAAMIAEVQEGLRTMASCYDDLGEDGREQIIAVADEAAFIDQLAKERNMPPDRIRKSIGDSLKIDLESAAQQQAEEDQLSGETPEQTQKRKAKANA